MKQILFGPQNRPGTGERCDELSDPRACSAQYLALSITFLTGQCLTQPLDGRVQTPRFRELAQALRIGNGQGRVRDVVLNWDVRNDINYGRRHVQIVGCLTKFFELGGGEPGVGGPCGRNQLVESAVFGEQFECCFFAHSGNAGEPIGGVAAQGRHLGVLRAGRRSVAFFEPSLINDVDVRNAAPQVENADLAGVIDKLEQVAVASDDVYGRVFSGGTSRQCADDVVGFVTIYTNARDPR